MADMHRLILLAAKHPAQPASWILRHASWLKLAMLVVGLGLWPATATALRPSMQPRDDWQAEWIGVVGDSKPNTWICFRKQVEFTSRPEEATARIACDSKYWLWINGELVVFEGQLKRGPTPQDTYFDVIDLARHFRAGENTIAILVCHFGRHGFSHNSSGKAGLLFDAEVDGQSLLSDCTWKVRIHPAFGTTDPPLDNVRPPEANLRFDARHDIGPWEQPEYDDDEWGPPTIHGRPPAAPWNLLYERPIPSWRNSGLLDYVNTAEIPSESSGHAIVARLPGNCHVTPYLKIEAPAGLVIGLQTDIQDLYGRLPQIEVHRHEYVTRAGLQEFELPQWINGHEVHYKMPAGVKIVALKYRETGFDTEVVGRFSCNDPELNQLWEESRQTLSVTMRDTYMDCPDRERAQWWGDAVNELGEAFYVFEPIKAPLLARKAIYELTRWQRSDGTLYSPVPSGIRRPGMEFPLDGSWNQELPQQMLASVGWYGFWTYYWYSGDRDTIVAAYPAVRRYLGLWKLGSDGLVVHRPGGWDWTDWGEQIDTPVVENAWFYLALKGAIAMAELTGNEADLPGYQHSMRLIAQSFNQQFWHGDHYRSPGYTGKTDDRAQAMAVVSGLANADQYPAIAEVLQAEGHASPYLEKYVLEALMQMGRSDLAVARMKIRYRAMLTDDQTTLWECFDEMVLDGFGSLGRGTYNHAWSGGPLTILSQYIAGIAPTEPAFKSYHVLPQLGPLTHVDVCVPTRYGNITCQCARNESQLFSLQLHSPSQTTAVVGIPAAEVTERATIEVNGTTVWRKGEFLGSSMPVKLHSQDAAFIKFAVSPGQWQFVVSEKRSPETH